MLIETTDKVLISLWTYIRRFETTGWSTYSRAVGAWRVSILGNNARHGRDMCSWIAFMAISYVETGLPLTARFSHSPYRPPHLHSLPAEVPVFCMLSWALHGLLCLLQKGQHSRRSQPFTGHYQMLGAPNDQQVHQNTPNYSLTVSRNRFLSETISA